ncbi:hypothetical protein Arub01_37020 [Actinomadura rubrobrunea]|uniref:Uncharacterized protein n=1 Tax=Actinomadura rubrobrunea TaxID=115335 RepID=A0A9W6PYS9_9ACTN|nr:hypothetical protein [Actinomadura rubrobrunea]GLW65458.1 hypothetical protein Arub01_37020 [Actinomadura rubrobrunea]
MWLAAAAGWGVIAVGLRRGLSGTARRAALLAHAMTLPGLVLGASLVGFGSLHATVAVAAEWWALAAVTGLRPERLTQRGALPRLAAWLVLAAAAAAAATALVLPP